jgi:hypothetical protein
MRNFLRETFESIYTASKVPNKVMSGYVDDCIISLIRHTTFRSSIQLITTEARESRSKGVRERCMVRSSSPVSLLSVSLSLRSSRLHTVLAGIPQ